MYSTPSNFPFFDIVGDTSSAELMPEVTKMIIPAEKSLSISTSHLDVFSNIGVIEAPS